MTTRLDEIKKRLEAATPGQWKLCHHLQSPENDASCPCGYRGSIWGSDGEHVVCEMGSTLIKGEEALCCPRYTRGVELSNAQFIAHAPTDIAYLLESCSIYREALDEMALKPYKDSDLTSLMEWVNARSRSVLARVDALGKEEKR